ncbi:cysteine dioxygenase [Marinitenerispora sediminis]|uniref:Cysteine dioxygenase n=1 Tax=Marinitenerispora sediminis TaxID=1931232 RepID=A0A368T1E0_9ACTN|nr:cysteine dioxygenase family protein [Marinitenerispora sediminis]RCV47802.1 cysteine dioxygenase [Marinitenerispora sediminis]RCV48662.1 cysteine dioxygenase [Marinitenerispora sediminis]RCV53546.1 cysteine dioxygenase [Marinitenerispora sediminis]
MTIAESPARSYGPTPLTLDELVELTRATAEEVRAGLHEIHFDAEHRWSVRLRSDTYADIWLITWTPDQSTTLHDHAGSLGALTVVDGVLTERVWRVAAGGAGLHDRALVAGRGVAFPVGYVHDVVNTAAAPAVSVHAYSPPLTAMSYYRVDEAGALRRTHSVLTHDPEPDVPTLSEVPTGPRPAHPDRGLEDR